MDNFDDVGYWSSATQCEAMAEIEYLRQQLASARAKIDALMLEYCPNEMTKEQLDEWARNQRPVEEK